MDVYLEGKLVGGDPGDLAPKGTPPAKVFASGTRISVALLNADSLYYYIHNIVPEKPITDIPPLSEAAAVTPPFLSASDPWLLETKAVRSMLNPCPAATAATAMHSMHGRKDLDPQVH